MPVWTDRSATFQFMMEDQDTQNFCNCISTVEVFLNMKKPFDKTRHSGILYELSELERLASLINLTASFRK
jgi:hypothetical protein